MVSRTDIGPSELSYTMGRPRIDEYNSSKFSSMGINLANNDDDLTRVNEKLGYENNQKSDAIEFQSSSYRNDDFFAESPYFDAFVKKEMNSVAIVAETVNDIAAKTQDFAQSGLRLAASTRKLASSCRLDPKQNSTSDVLQSKRKALEPDVVDGLGRLGDVLDEMASAQEHLCRFFESYMVSSLQSIAEKDKTLLRMREEAQIETDEAEQIFVKYFHAGEDSWGNLEKGNTSGSGGVKRSRRGSMETVNRGGNMGNGRFGHFGGGSDALGNSRRGSMDSSMRSDRGFGARHSRRSSMETPRYGVHSGTNYQTDTIDTKANQVTRWKHKLAKIRSLQISAEFKRYQLATHIIISKHQKNYEMSRLADYLVSEMCTYFSHCSSLVTGLSHRTTNIKEKCKEFQIKHLKQQKRHWGDRGKALESTLALAKKTEMGAQFKSKNLSHASMSVLDRKSHEYVVKEENDQIWDLPAKLASYTGHSRPIAKGVLAEGWLYRESSSAFYRNNRKSRSWFLVRRDGIFILKPSLADYHHDSRTEDPTEFIVERVNVCDLKLCTVRNYEGQDPSTRFCFELITPANSYSERLVLQARGPHEFEKWLDAIRTGISYQLAAEEDTTPTSSPTGRKSDSYLSMRKKLSLVERFGMTSSKPRRSTSDIRLKILDRGRSLFGNDMSVFDDFFEADDLTPEVKEIMKANPTCADCGEKCPEWASLNLGVLICVECSGVHRSLGVHISKVRSLKLDALSERESQLLLSLGNKRVNQLWENQVPIDPEERKLDIDSWIYRKYVEKEFIATDIDFSTESIEIASRKLYEASKRADVVGVAKAIIYGGNVNWKNPNEENKTVLGICGVNLQDPEDGNVVVCQELLSQNGAEIKATKSLTTPPIGRRFSLFNLTSNLMDEVYEDRI